MKVGKKSQKYYLLKHEYIILKKYEIIQNLLAFRPLSQIFEFIKMLQKKKIFKVLFINTLDLLSIRFIVFRAFVLSDLEIKKSLVLENRKFG